MQALTQLSPERSIPKRLYTAQVQSCARSEIQSPSAGAHGFRSERNHDTLDDLDTHDHSLTIVHVYSRNEQEAQLPKRNCVTRHVIKFVLCFTMYGCLRGFKQQVAFKVNQGHCQRWHSIGCTWFRIKCSIATMPLYCTVNDTLSLI